MESVPSLVWLCQDKIMSILKENRYSARLVRELCRCVPDYLLERVFEELLASKSITEGALVAYFTPARQRITIHQSPHIRNSLFKLIGTNCPNLRDLDLSDCPQVSNSVVRAILQGCACLESISLNRCHRITDAAFDFSTCPFEAPVGCMSLEAISLQGCPQITGEIVDTLNKHCRRLLCLNLSQCKHVSGQQLQRIFLHHSLRILNLAFVDQVCDETFSIFAGGAPPLPTSSPTSAPASSSSSVVKRPLERLDLCHSSITDCSVLHIAATLQQLLELRLPWCANVTDVGVIQLIGSCRKLQVLDLRSCAITDATLRAIGMGCVALQELDLSWCVSVSNDGMEGLLAQPETHLQTLRTLSLIWCPQLTDVALALLARLSSLRKVHVGGSAGFTTQGLDGLATRGVEVLS